MKASVENTARKRPPGRIDKQCAGFLASKKRKLLGRSKSPGTTQSESERERSRSQSPRTVGRRRAGTDASEPIEEDEQLDDSNQVGNESSIISS